MDPKSGSLIQTVVPTAITSVSSVHISMPCFTFIDNSASGLFGSSFTETAMTAEGASPSWSKQ